jgi:hypothetical protein
MKLSVENKLYYSTAGLAIPERRGGSPCSNKQDLLLKIISSQSDEIVAYARWIAKQRVKLCKEDNLKSERLRNERSFPN